MTADLIHNLRAVQQRISDLCSSLSHPPPRLVAVSKTFPAECVLTCYEAGQRHFGENYVEELSEKVTQLSSKIPEIRWHFIGRIQSNKIRKLCSIPGLWCVETLSSQKHCDLFQTNFAQLNLQLRVFIQVNTSREEQKGGIYPEQVQGLAEHIIANCPNLKLLGLMTIGSLVESKTSSDQNSDFELLRSLRDKLCMDMKLDPPLELSMGMSSDFETALKGGSTNVRIGSTIFGNRTYPSKTN